MIGEIIKEERRIAKMTQEQLAEKIGAKKALSHELKADKQIFNCLRCFGF